MKELEDILNCISDFHCYICDELISFPGILKNADEYIILQCKMKIEWYRKIDVYSSINIWGNVNGIPVSFLGVYLKDGVHCYERTDISLTFVPSEIITGQSTPMEIQVTQMKMSASAFNHMFSALPLQPTHSFSKDNPSVLNYTFPGVIEAADKYGKLCIYQTFKEEWSRNKINYKFSPIVEYNFHHPLKVMDAVEKLAAVRNLFVFFADHYLPLENILFESPASENEVGQEPCICTLYLNVRENIPILQEPFLITTDAFSENFEMLWNRWLQIYEEAIYIPTLFYEIICNRSTRVNRFLNLSQAIEVYSNRYRKEAVAEAARIREKTKKGKKPPIHLNHRFEDIFMLLNSHLNIEKSKIPIISKALSDMRNFFTHYDEAKHTKPSYQEMFAACHVLEFVLLAIIYHEVGISDNYITSIKKRPQFQRLDEFVERLARYPN